MIRIQHIQHPPVRPRVTINVKDNSPRFVVGEGHYRSGSHIREGDAGIGGGVGGVDLGGEHVVEVELMVDEQSTADMVVLTIPGSVPG